MCVPAAIITIRLQEENKIKTQTEDNSFHNFKINGRLTMKIKRPTIY